MNFAKLTLVERPHSWVLVIEPWALSFDVEAGQRVTIEIGDQKKDELFELEIAEDGTYLAFPNRHFNVLLGDRRESFVFP
jgi:hypothetical protein